MIMNIFLLLIGLVAGYLIGFYIIKTTIARKFVSKSKWEELEQENTRLRIEVATGISKQELNENFVPRSLYESLQDQHVKAGIEIQNKSDQVLKNQERILELTSESREKLSRQHVAEFYVTKETFKIIKENLDQKEKLIIEKNDSINQLTRQL